MKKTLVAIMFVMTLVFTVSSAFALTLTQFDTNYVGYVNDGIPSNIDDQRAYLLTLTSLAIGVTLDQTGSGGEFYSRVGSTLASLPAVPATGIKDDTGNNLFEVNTNDPFYILGKYDAFRAGSLVFLVDASIGDLVYLPTHFNNRGLSHFTVFETSTSVPEPGMLALLGMGLVGIGIFRRRK